MPRRIQMGGSSNVPLPTRDTQHNMPVSLPAVEQGSASISSAPSSSRLRRQETLVAETLRAQLPENSQTNSENWQKRLFRELTALRLLENRVSIPLEKVNTHVSQLQEKFEECLDHGIPGNEKQMQTLKEYIEELTLAQAPLNEGIGDYEKHMPSVTSKAKACLDEFEVLSKATKEAIFRAQDKDKDLRLLMDKIKPILVSHIGTKALGVNTVTKIERNIDRVKQWLLVPRSSALVEKMSTGDFSPDVCRDVDDMIAEYVRLFEHAKKITTKQVHTIEDSEALLEWKHLKGLGDSHKRMYSNDAKLLVSNGWMLHSNHSFFSVTNSIYYGLSLLLPLVLHDNNEQKNNVGLQNWHERTQSFFNKDFSPAHTEFNTIVSLELSLIEKDDALAKLKGQPDPKNLREKMMMELPLLLSLLRQWQGKLEKIFRACETSIAEYENLEGIAKDERVTSLMNAFAESITDLLYSRERSAQFWEDRLQDLEDGMSYLPSKTKTRKSRPQPSQTQPFQPQNIHKTTDGLVIGQINPKGKLERLGNLKNVTDTYFRDDSDNWVRDYGDGLEDEQAAPPLSQPTVRIRHLITEADKIVDASTQLSERVRTDIAAIDASGDDYTQRLDKKIDHLNQAISNKAKAINKVIDILVDLEGMQIKDTSSEDSIAILREKRRQLTMEKDDLLKQLEDVQKEQNIHSRKRRDPSGANFDFLREKGHVETITKNFSHRKNPTQKNDWLDRYTISFKSGPQGEKYEPWIVHAHFESNTPNAKPVRVHMKRDAEKDWGVDKKPYHSLPLSEKIFDLVTKEAQKKQAVQEKQGTSKKGGARRHR